MKRYFVYILECSDKSYYTGVTNNLERRVLEHKSGLNPDCYTYSRRPVELVFYVDFQFIKDAIEFEKQVKGWSRKKKEAIINDNWEKLKSLSECKNNSSHKYFHAPLNVPLSGVEDCHSERSRREDFENKNKPN